MRREKVTMRDSMYSVKTQEGDNAVDCGGIASAGVACRCISSHVCPAADPSRRPFPEKHQRRGVAFQRTEGGSQSSRTVQVTRTRTGGQRGARGGSACPRPREMRLGRPKGKGRRRAGARARWLPRTARRLRHSTRLDGGSSGCLGSCGRRRLVFWSSC